MLFVAVAFFCIIFVLLANIFVSLGLSLLLTILINFVYVCSSHAPRQLESGTAQLIRGAKDVLWRKRSAYVKNVFWLTVGNRPPTFNYDETLPGIYLGRLPHCKEDLAELKALGVAGRTTIFC